MATSAAPGTRSSTRDDVAGDAPHLVEVVAVDLDDELAVRAGILSLTPSIIGCEKPTVMPGMLLEALGHLAR